jgi:osmotically inducible protein OsmC
VVSTAGKSDSRPFKDSEEQAMSETTGMVHWEGSGSKGLGKISTDTGALKEYPYGFGSRFEGKRDGTNPEELLGAAHAACFTMAFAFACEKAGYTAAQVDTVCKVRLSKVPDGFLIDRLALTLRASVPKLTESLFQKMAEEVKRGCPLSKALASVPEITLEATLLP